MKRVRKRFFSCIMVALMMAGLFAFPASAKSSNNVSNVSEGVVRVVSMETNNDPEDIVLGTAFGIGTIGEDTDIFITNRHVVTWEDTNNNYHVYPRVYLMQDDSSLSITDYYYSNDYSYHSSDYNINTSRMVECDVIYYSEEYDFAVLQALEPIGRVALELAESANILNVDDHESVYALGYPGASDAFSNISDLEDSGYYDTETGIDLLSITQTYSGSVESVTQTDGIISSYQTLPWDNDCKAILHTAHINNGNSGGPLVTADGKVLGINTYGDTDSDINCAIYIDYVEDYLDEAGIPYNVQSHSGISTWLIVLIIVIIVVVVILILLAVLRSRKKKKDGSGTIDSASTPNAPPTYGTTGQAAAPTPPQDAQGTQATQFCPYCGAELKEGAKFCGSCGRQL